MTGLLHLDPFDLPLDSERLLVRAMALGRQTGTLTDRTAATLVGHLRLEGMAHARRTRTGLRLGGDALRRGVLQAVVCLELALEEAGAGDLAAAARALSTVPLADLHRQGWELAWTRLAQMRRESAHRQSLRSSRLLGEYLPQLRLWATLVPEAWSATDPQGRPVEVDPQVEYARFCRIVARAELVGSLPSAATGVLLASLPEGATFAGLLRRLVIALALGQDDLRITSGQARRFQRACLVDGLLRPEVRERFRGELSEHLGRTLGQEEHRGWILEELDQAIAVLEQGAAGDLGQWCRTAGSLDQDVELLIAEGDLHARRAARADLPRGKSGIATLLDEPE